MEITDYTEVITNIDEMFSYWMNYRGKAIGRAIHYIYIYAGLNAAEQAIFNGNGKITCHGKPFATVDWTRGFPYFNFVDEYHNEFQNKLLVIPR